PRRPGVLSRAHRVRGPAQLPRVQVLSETQALAVDRTDSLYEPGEGDPGEARARRQAERIRAAVVAAYAGAPRMAERLRECGLVPEAAGGLSSACSPPAPRLLPDLSAGRSLGGEMRGDPSA